jgi:serine/threonine-protein kinase
MGDDARVQQLLDELHDQQTTPEEVCALSPELLPVVRNRWLQMCRVQANLDMLFPPSDPPGSRIPNSIALPQIPGYEVEAVLGRGGMGVVFRARHLRLNRVVALKMSLSGGFCRARELERFQREAEAEATLRHPNIVQVHDVGEHEGRPYFTMEYVDGGSLAQKLLRAPIPPRQAAALVATLAGAMQAAHESGIMHRDLKPSNILLTADGSPKISDFGLARRIEGGAKLTQTGVPVGTASYMAPEQAQGDARAIGPGTDVYALGAILYELLTGRPPFEGETSASVIQKVINQDPLPPSRLHPKVPRDLETICLKCLQKPPSHRYATAAALAADLGRYERGEPIAARPVSRFERIVRWVRRKPTAAALLLTALALLVLAIVNGVNQWRVDAKRRAEVDKWNPRLELVRQLQAEGRFGDARAVLQHLPDTDLGELSDRIRGTLAELDLVQKLEGIRHNRTAVVDGRFDPEANQARSDRQYEAAFTEAEVGSLDDAPSVVAARVHESPVRGALVAALDDWALCTRVESRRGWIFAVARGADPDPSGWRDRIRDPALAPKELTQLADTAVLPAQSVQLLIALALRMQAAHVDAIPFLRRVQQQYPGDFWACFTLADALWQMKPAECIRYYQAALAIRPETALAHLNVGRALAEAKRIDEAIEHFREAVRLDAKYAHAISNLGLALSIKGNNDEGLRLVKEGLALDGRSVRSYFHLADVLFRMGQHEEALADLRRALEIDPSSLKGHHYLGNDLMQLGRYDEAQEQFEVALRLDPDSPLPHFGLGALWKNQGRIDEAIKELEFATRLEPPLFQVHAMLAECWRSKGEPQKALLEYDKEIALHPDDAASNLSKQGIQVQLGLGELVRAEWQDALKSASPGYEAWYRYAVLCLYLGHPAEYERACHELLARFESSTNERVCQLVGLACLLGSVRREDTARAAAVIDRAVGKASASFRPYLLATQGFARYRLRDLDGAVKTLQGDAARTIFARLVLAMAQRRTGQPGEALRSFANAARSHDWRSSRADYLDAWLNDILRREAEPLVMPNLKALLAGQEKPNNMDEQLALASVCHSMWRTAQAASMFAEAFAADPKLATQLDAAHRYYAATCAARAGCGVGEDVAGLSEKKRARWREQARVWLRDDLVAKKALLSGAPIAERSALPGKLDFWFRDPALACVREDGDLAKLVPAEKEAWLAIWRDAKSLLAQAKSHVALLEQGRRCASRQEWDQAANCYARFLARGPTDDGHFWFEYAALSLLRGDRSAYAKACAHLMEAHSKAAGPRAYHVARARTLASDAVAEAAAAGRLAEKELQENAKQFWSLTEQGALAYRAGRFQEAVPLFQQSLDADAKPGRAVLNWLWLALGNQRLGKSEDAHRWLAKAQAWLDQYPDGVPARAEEDLGLHIHNWLEAHVLRREAEALLSPK